jgi:hypothetical protein
VEETNVDKPVRFSTVRRQAVESDSSRAASGDMPDRWWRRSAKRSGSEGIMSDMMFAISPTEGARTPTVVRDKASCALLGIIRP